MLLRFRLCFFLLKLNTWLSIYILFSKELGSLLFVPFPKWIWSFCGHWVDEKWSLFSLKWKIIHFPTQKKKIWISDDSIRRASITFISSLIPDPQLLNTSHTQKSCISNTKLDFIWNVYIGSWFGVATNGHFSQNKLNFVISLFVKFYD